MRHEGAIDMRISAIAGRQKGVIATRQLRQIGLSPSAISRRARAGRLHRLHQGVYAVGHLGLPREALWMAAILACGGGPRAAGPILERWGAALGRLSASMLWGLLRCSDRPAEVVVPGGGGRRRRKGIRVHRCPSLASGDVTLHLGIPVTSPSRTLADLERLVGRGQMDERTLRRAARQADVLGLPVRSSNRCDRTRSDLERDFLRLCRRHGLPDPEVNIRVGRHLVDFLWRKQRVTVETDGYRYHRGQEAFRADHRRDLDFREAGYDVLRFSEEQLEREQVRIASAVAAALRVGSRGGD
jgi:very-short-patch-repair endonuclease